MTKIGVISDTHGLLRDEILAFLADVDEIWHAGDIGTEAVLDKLEQFKPLRAVYGNMDGTEIRMRTKEKLIFQVENVKVYITHIGGYPQHYPTKIKNELLQTAPNIFVAGHSHILKVMPDKQLKLLHINPGAAGNSGDQKVATAIRFCINNDKLSNMEVYELPRR